MKAALVTAFGEPPRYEDFTEPEATGTHEAVVDVLAVGLHPRVQSQADGSHYTSTDELPLIPGVDGVGRTADGRLRYFVLRDTQFGSMSERTVIDLRRSVELPDGADPVQVAAVMNPAMSSWVALRRRIELGAGQSVMVLAATGSAGQLALRVARRLGAGHVIAVGRGAERLAALDADVTVSLDDDADTIAANLGRAGADVDVVLDYLWGKPTADALYAIIPNRTDDAQPLTWIQIGSVAGLEAPIPSAALRAARLQLIGSGQGSVPTADIVAELGALVAEVAAGTFAVATRTVPLADVTAAWTDAATAERVVIVP
ncbi:zinc-binding alcohol dehydrogenase family protein [Galbitalea sp. SE-J8]|uniref:quinone oxidoreductase family protein n=1 Tax=Galbitalea sp. SE-J8 TaxID=3054952 RepID=UPI00259C73CD|nr:zinc-binding alcohol dehydrogenase family protein [Galbitalea sp. SE-J8]MDM4762020.1 zinc-binding alcohol dehydrogenase family protein [Galbitalea sp. SE-J8]